MLWCEKHTKRATHTTGRNYCALRSLRTLARAS